MKNLAQAILAVMSEVKGIEKNLTVGSGNYSYKGVADNDVKEIIGQAMNKNGLCILPIDVTPSVEVTTWQEKKRDGEFRKQQVFTEVQTKYLLLHESGESQEIAGYGHGVDSQDKSAGKATTYALKYALLYMFMTPTGSIPDTDKQHSDEIEIPTRKIDMPPKKLITDKQFTTFLKRYMNGETEIFKTAVKNGYQLTKDQKEEVLNAKKLLEVNA